MLHCLETRHGLLDTLVTLLSTLERHIVVYLRLALYCPLLIDLLSDLVDFLLPKNLRMAIPCAWCHMTGGSAFIACRSATISSAVCRHAGASVALPIFTIDMNQTSQTTMVYVPRINIKIAYNYLLISCMLMLMNGSLRCKIVRCSLFAAAKVLIGIAAGIPTTSTTNYCYWYCL